MPVVLQINSCANWGSTGKIVEGINNLAQSRGYEVYTAYGRYATPSNSKLIKIGDRFSQLSALVRARLCDNEGLASSVATRRLLKRIEDISPDIIHLHNLHGYYINYVLLFDYLSHKRIPVIWTFHDCWPFTGHCAHYVYENCYRWKQECHNCPLRAEYPKSFFIDRSRKNYNEKKTWFTKDFPMTIVTVSEWLRSQVFQSFFTGKETKVIYNGIDTAVFKPLSKDTIDAFKAKHGLGGKKIFLAVSSVWPESKGLSHYNDLASLLEEDEALVLIGVDSRTRKRLSPKIISYPRTDSVDELVTWYNAAEVVLSLSSAESFGLTIVEGFACGTPSVVFNNTALTELVAPGTGIVADNGDVNQVRKALSIIRGSGKASYSDSCRKRATSLYDKASCYSQYLDLYDSKLNCESIPH